MAADTQWPRPSSGGAPRSGREDLNLRPLRREMYRLAVEENLGYKAIADELTRRGYPAREGRAWAAYSVQRILTNEAAGGTLV